MNIQTPFIVLSASRAELTPELNAERSALLERQLQARDLSFKRVEGAYKGQREISFLVLTPDSNAEALATRLARRYGQESVLAVDANRAAALLFLRPDVGGEDIASIEPIGYWRSAAQAEAESLDAFTRDGSDYYITTPALAVRQAE